MGYYSSFEIAWKTPAQMEVLDGAAVAAALNEILECEDGDVAFEVRTNGHVHQCDELKWYEAKEDMATLSARYPSVLFTLDREGEEAGDIERTFYRDGKLVGGGKAQIILPEPPE